MQFAFGFWNELTRPNTTQNVEMPKEWCKNVGVNQTKLHCKIKTSDSTNHQKLTSQHGMDD